MDAIPLFSTDHSICDSILTLSKAIYKMEVTTNDKDEEIEKETDEVTIKPPASVFAIAKIHDIKPLYLVESSLSGFWGAYQTAKNLKIPMVFGYKVAVCGDMAVKTPDSVFSESNVIVFLKNAKGYQDLIKISSKASLEGFYYRPRIDWKVLNELWTPNLALGVPFYSSFIAKNLLRFKYCAFPNFDHIKDITFFNEEHGLPFDALITRSVKSYLNSITIGDKYPLVQAHSIYYYKDEDARALQTLKCIQKRATISKPNLDHFGSKEFSFESYTRKYDRR